MQTLEQQELQIFNNPDFGQVRMVDVDGKPYFMASDIAKALGYARPNDAINQHCRATVKHSTPISGKMQDVNFIPEGDLYRLIVNSKLPTAEKFERWVFDEVLPQIRQTGGYIPSDGLSDAEIMAKALMIAQQTIANKDKLLTFKDQQIAELQPKADYTDRILQSKGTININAIAKDYGTNAKKLNLLLHNLGVQYKQDGQWLLYSKYQAKGYTHSKTIDFKRSDGRPDTRLHTQWTQKGRLFLYELLKKRGILPVIEREE